MVMYEVYCYLSDRAKECEDFQRYSDNAVNENFDGWIHGFANRDEITHLLELIYQISRGGLEAMIKAEENGSMLFYEKFGLNPRTAQNWLNKERKAPEYTIRLLGFAVITDVFLKRKCDTVSHP